MPSECLTFYNIETATHTRTHVHTHHTAALNLDQETGVHGERREKEREKGQSGVEDKQSLYRWERGTKKCSSFYQ